jgi:hypothetical protein
LDCFFQVLTLHSEMDPLADRGRYPIGGDAQVSAHVQSTDPADVENLAINHIGWGHKSSA